MQEIKKVFKKLSDALSHPAIYLLLFFFVFAAIFAPAEYSRKLAGDGQDYVAHAFTIALDGDLDYSNEIPALSGRGLLGAHPSPIGFIGSGVAAAPFVAVGGLIDRLSGHPVIENRLAYKTSFSYLFFQVASIFYLIVACFLYRKTAERLTGKTFSVMENFFILTGFGILFYAFSRFHMTHAYGHFFLSATLYTSVNLFRPGHKSFLYLNTQRLLLVLSMVMTVFVRPSTLNVFLIPVLIWLFYADRNKESHGIKKAGAEFLHLLVILLIISAPFLLINLYFYNSLWFAVPITKFPFIPTLTRVIKNIADLYLVVFSSEFGILYISTILIVGLISLLIWAFSSLDHNLYKGLFIVSALGYASLPFAIALYSQSTGSSYAFRYLFPLFPAAYLGYLFLTNEIEGRKKLFLRTLVLAGSVLGLISQILYGTSNLHNKPQINAFGRQHNYSVKGYVPMLIKEIVRPAAWIEAIGKGYPGFVVLKVIGDDINSLRPYAQYFGIPFELIQRGQERFSSIPDYYSWLFLLMLVAASLGMYYALLSGKGAKKKKVIAQNDL